MMDITYQDPQHPGSFGGVDALYRAVQGKVSKKEIKNWLQSVDAYTLHKPVKRKFPTNRVIVHAMDQQWQADLADMGTLSRHNDGFRYILTCIDILSKYAWTIPLKQKRGVDIVNAFQKIFAERIPKYLQTDQGTEFKNRKFQKFLKENQVKFFTTFNTTKASVVERFNRTLKTKMWKYFTTQNTYRYLDVLDSLTDSYNHTHHSSIKRAPAEVNSTNEQEVWATLYANSSKHKRIKPQCVLKEGDLVRVSKIKMTFEKGYETNWTEEVFKVSECVKREPAVYRIKDLLGEPIQGTFYLQELQQVKMKEEFPIEKVLKKRFKKNQMEYFVKYRGYPHKFNQWVPASQVVNLTDR